MKTAAEIESVYRKFNKKKIKECQKQYRKANKDKLAAHQKWYYETNKEKIAEYLRQRRQARKMEVVRCIDIQEEKCDKKGIITAILFEKRYKRTKATDFRTGISHCLL